MKIPTTHDECESCMLYQGKIKQLQAENKRLKKVIEDFGSNPAGFDWAVLERLEQLEKDSKILHALEAGGVDNWEWYAESLAEVWEEEDE